MTVKAEWVWMDGKMVKFEDATVPIMTYTLHYGYGTFEGVRAYQRTDGNSHVFRLREHVKRLRESAHILGMKLAYSQDEIENACLDVLKINRFATGYLRPLVYLGSEGMGLGALDNSVHLAISAWQWGAYLGDDGLKNGIRSKVSSYQRGHVNISMVKGKICGQYVNSVMAKREALNAGYNEAIMLDPQGYVAECTGENLFMVKDQVLITAPYGASILGGITRDTVIQLAKDLGYKVQERLFSRDEMYVADEVFLCGTAAEITPVKEIDDRKVGTGEPGYVTRKIAGLFFDIVKGSQTQYGEWRYDFSL
jgi:branched-chain amino acid aminotransferase